MKNKNTLLAAVLLFLFVNLTGCNMLNKEDCVHAYSCGAVALYELQLKEKNFSLPTEKKLMNEETLREKSDIIRSQSLGIGSLGRRILSIFGNEAYSITWPHELYGALEELGYEYNIIKGPEDHLRLKLNLLKLGGRWGIVLVKKKNSATSWHWQFFPSRKNELGEYDDKTVLKMVIEIKRKGKSEKIQK